MHCAEGEEVQKELVELISKLGLTKLGTSKKNLLSRYQIRILLFFVTEGYPYSLKLIKRWPFSTYKEIVALKKTVKFLEK